jgi:hypothetical protein
MNEHRHLSEEQIFERVSSSEPLPEIAGCGTCELEASAQRAFLGELQRIDREAAPDAGWDDLVLRNRIRKAISQERPHGASIFERFLGLRPAFLSAALASLVLFVWNPMNTPAPGDAARVVSASRIPAWTPLPDEPDDEGLAVLVEWTPNEDELAVAHCRAACLAGLTTHEEESLLNAVAVSSSRLPATESSPL